MDSDGVNSKRARQLINKVTDISLSVALYTPVLIVVYGYIGKECVRYTAGCVYACMKRRLSK
jgi:hypothetical protein